MASAASSAKGRRWARRSRISRRVAPAARRPRNRRACSRIMRCTMRTRGDSSRAFSSARAAPVRAGRTPPCYFLWRAERPAYTLAASPGGEVADLLAIRDLRVYLDVDAGVVKALDGVSFSVPQGGTVALVGESGSGKSVLAQAVMGILPRIARIESGEILFRDPRSGGEVDLSRLDVRGREMQHIRGGRISIIFQEPRTALSPLHTS